MAIIYYPRSKKLLERTTDNGGYQQVILDVYPNTIVMFDSSSHAITDVGTLAATASWAINSVNGASGTNIGTGSTYPITASWAVNTVNGGSGTTLSTGSSYPITSSWATNVTNVPTPTLSTGSLYQITSSWALYALSGQTGSGYTNIIDLVKQGANGNGSTDNTTVFTTAATNGGTYLLPYGIYMTDKFSTSKALTIIGIPDASTGALPEIKLRTIVTGNDSFITSTGNRLEFRNIKFNGNGLTNTLAYVIYCDDIAHITLDNVEISSWRSKYQCIGVRVQNPTIDTNFVANRLKVYDLYVSGTQGPTFGSAYGIWIHSYQRTDPINFSAGFGNKYIIQNSHFEKIYATADKIGGNNCGVARGIEDMGGGQFLIQGNYFTNIESCTSASIPVFHDADCISLASNSESYHNVSILNNTFYKVSKRAVKSQMDNPESHVLIDGFTWSGGHNWSTTVTASYSVISPYGGHVIIRNGTCSGSGLMMEFSDVGGEIRSILIDKVKCNVGKLYEGQTVIVDHSTTATTFGFMSAFTDWHNDMTVTIANCDLTTAGRFFSLKCGATLNIVNSNLTSLDKRANLFSLSGTPSADVNPMKINIINSTIAGYTNLIRSTIAGGQYDINLVGSKFVNLYGKKIESLTRTGNIATCSTYLPHELNHGDTVRVSGSAQSEYNGTFKVTGSSSTVFGYPVSGTPTTPATFDWDGWIRNTTGSYLPVGSILSKAIQTATATGCTTYHFDSLGFFSNQPEYKKETGTHKIGGVGTATW